MAKEKAEAKKKEEKKELEPQVTEVSAQIPAVVHAGSKGKNKQSHDKFSKFKKTQEESVNGNR